MLHTDLGNRRRRRFHTFPPHDDHDVLKGHFNFAQLATFLLCSNRCRSSVHFHQVLGLPSTPRVPLQHIPSGSVIEGHQNPIITVFFDAGDLNHKMLSGQSNQAEWPDVEQTSAVREIRTLRSVGAGSGRLSPATRWAISNDRPYRDLIEPGLEYQQFRAILQRACRRPGCPFPNSTCRSTLGLHRESLMRPFHLSFLNLAIGRMSLSILALSPGGSR